LQQLTIHPIDNPLIAMSDPDNCRSSLPFSEGERKQKHATEGNNSKQQ
jgi:hypothetical protein